jgi:hypothetical protein
MKIYFLKNKRDVLGVFKDFLRWAEKDQGYKMKIVRTDGGLEYGSSNFKSFLS